MKTQKKYNIKRIILILSGVIIASAGIFSALSELTNSKKISSETPVADYRSDINVSYNVIPKANMLYGDGVLDEGLTYISEFVNQVDSNFEYKVSGDSTMNVSGYYTVNVVFTGYVDSEGKGVNVWSKQKEIVPRTEFNINATGDVLKQRVRIDVDDYNRFVKTVIEASNIKVPVKATVTMGGEAVIKNSKGETKEPIMGSLIIPLDKSYFNIEKQGIESKDGKIVVVEKVNAPLNMLKLAVSIILALSGSIIIAYETISKPLGNQEIQLKHVKKMLSSYGSRAAAVSKISAENMENSYEIKLMEDLVKVADELGKPILYEYKENVKDIEYFCVIEGNTMYRYNIEEKTNESELANVRYLRVEI